MIERTRLSEWVGSRAILNKVVFLGDVGTSCVLEDVPANIRLDWVRVKDAGLSN